MNSSTSRPVLGQVSGIPTMPREMASRSEAGVKDNSTMLQSLKYLQESISMLAVEVDAICGQLRPVLVPAENKPASPEAREDDSADLYRVAVIIKLQSEQLQRIRIQLNDARNRLDV